MKTSITIITPCFNAEDRIAETIESVLSQSAVASGRAELQYLVCDGGSTDRTMAVIDSRRCSAMTAFSEPDRGMYDALAKGLRRATGSIVAYLNAGDIYNRHAFDVVLDVFENRQVKWLTGCTVLYNERSQITFMKLPFKYRGALFASGLYGKLLPTVQQESTFWSSSLHRVIDLDQLSRLRYAGDFYLWSRFSTVAELNIVESHLGGFKYHAGQLSENWGAYRAELEALSRDPRLHEYALAFVDRVLSLAPSRVKKQFNPQHLFRYDHGAQKWT